MIAHADNVIMLQMPAWYSQEGHIAVTRIKSRIQRPGVAPLVFPNYQDMRITDVSGLMNEGSADEKVPAQADAEKPRIG